MKKTIITVIGLDKVGIIGSVCMFLSENNINILEITQNIRQGYFNMMMIVDTTNYKKDMIKFNKELKAIGIEIGVDIKAQQEDIFISMHRI